MRAKQLALWPWRYPWSQEPRSLLSKIAMEAKAKIAVDYHFCSEPLEMRNRAA